MRGVIHELPDDSEGLAFAFVTQTRVGTWVHPDNVPGDAPQGRGGEAVHRRVRAEQWLVLGTISEEDTPVFGPFLRDEGPVQYSVMALGVAHVHTPIETVSNESLSAFTAAVYAEVLQ